MTKAKDREILRLQRLLEVERERAERAWAGYREALYQNADMRLKLEEIERVLSGEELQ